MTENETELHSMIWMLWQCEVIGVPLVKRIIFLFKIGSKIQRLIASNGSLNNFSLWKKIKMPLRNIFWDYSAICMLPDELESQNTRNSSSLHLFKAIWVHNECILCSTKELYQATKTMMILFLLTTCLT